MIKRCSKSHRFFKSKTEKTQIIGGETDFCAERFGYKREMNGISPSFSFQKRIPEVTCSGVAFAQAMPLCDGVAMLAANENKLYSWKPRTSAKLLYLAGYTTKYVRLHSHVYEGSNVKVIITGSRVIRIGSNSIIKITNMSKTLFDAVIHCGRIFGIDSSDRYLLRWSGYDFGEWTEAIDKAGYVRLDSELGKLVNLFVLNEKIVVLREYGITMLNALGDARHMRLDSEDKYRLPRVYEFNSVILGGQLWINTEKGLYVFDGGGVKQVASDPVLQGYELSNPQLSWDGRIYYNAKKGGECCLFEYDVETGEGTPFAKGCKYYFDESGNKYCFKNDCVYCLISGGDDPDRFWKSKPFVSGDGKARTLKYLYVEGDGQPCVEIDCDGRKRYTAGTGKHYVCEGGQTFAFKVTGSGAVTSLTAEWEVRE